MDEINVYDTKPIKRAFSKTAWAMLIYMAVFTAFQILFTVAGNVIWGAEALENSSVWKWAVSFLPQYVIAFPITVLVFMLTPAKPPVKQKMGTLRFLSFIPMAYAVTYAGSIIGNTLSAIISWGKASNAVTEYVDDTNIFVKIAILVIIGPLVEEILCRKLIIDRIAQYGEKVAVLVSALIFALFHTNLYQFFYAFGIGIILGYVYLRTGMLRYSTVIHAVMNFIGGVIAPYIISLTADMQDFSILEAHDMSQLLPMLASVAVTLVYSSVVMGVVVLGTVLLIMRRKTAIWQPAENEIPRVLITETVFLNAGMIVFTAITALLTVYSIFVK